MVTCGTAPPPRRVAPLATPGAMDPRRAQARSDNSTCQKITDRQMVVIITNIVVAKKFNFPFLLSG